MRKTLFFLSCFVLSTAFVHANPYFDRLKTQKETSNPLVEWEPVGPGMSGYIDKFWIHDTDPRAMFMHLDMGNAFGTWNRGNRWNSIRDSDNTGSELDGITAVEFSHQNPDFGLLLAKEGVYSTNNRGRSWNFLVDTDTSNSEKHNVLTVDPRNDRIWYIGAGQHWMIKFTHFNKDGLQYSNDRNHSEGFILKSTNRGRTWTKYSQGLPSDSDISKIIVHPENSNRLIISTQHGVYRSTNGGQSWRKSPGIGLPHNQPRDMVSYYNPQSGEFILYLLEVTHYTPRGSGIKTSGGVYRSYDSGRTWENMTGNLAINLNRINNRSYINKYWSTIAYWLGISPTEAKRRYPDLPTDTFSQFIRIGVDPDDPERVYLLHNFKHDYSFPPGNIWMTENGGDNWVAAAREGPYWANQVDRNYWVSRGNPLGANVQFSHVAREHAEHDNIQTGPRFLKMNSAGDVYTAFAQQVIRSTDNGRTWKQIDDFETSPGSGHWVGRGDSNLPGVTLNVNTRRPGQVLLGSGEHGLWRTTNDGHRVYPGAVAVEQLAGQSKGRDEALSISAIAVHPKNKNRIYSLQFRQTQRGALRVSQDNGQTWATRSTPLDLSGPNDRVFQRSLVIDPDKPKYMYFCVPKSELVYFSPTRWIRNGPASFSGHGIYKSSDAGRSWEIVGDGIPGSKSIYRLTLDPNNPKVIYAAANQTERRTSGGLYKSINRGESWTPVNLPAGIASVNEVVVHKSGALYIATGTYSNDRSTGGAWVSRNGGTSWRLLFDMPNVMGVSPSPLNEDIVLVRVGEARAIGNLNPGAYASVDGGRRWDKINGKTGLANRIVALEADPTNKDTYWAALFGSGFAKIDISPLLD